MPRAICVDWSEDDDELGVREDGYSLHLTREDAHSFIARSASRHSGYGTPHPVRVPEEVLEEVSRAGDGVYYPRPRECPYPAAPLMDVSAIFGVVRRVTSRLAAVFRFRGPSR